jgi:hypothetical protein
MLELFGDPTKFCVFGCPVLVLPVPMPVPVPEAFPVGMPMLVLPG